ncbi:hypothetical protein D2E26_0387 [Bifidobacterium dolichotidis]|uniref:Uncharacterized protein n=1 Tax=Bifidobacterium dolichotidis TaxID=2306976 RepID=A0A430FSG2_9BIFI|nr:hypothetical protein [Bifidobacterium dolichotidis]RSX55824.1 hypothetical protein D2E26_0387 [Bifidobacterium dolichotidis]
MDSYELRTSCILGIGLWGAAVNVGFKDMGSIPSSICWLIILGSTVAMFIWLTRKLSERVLSLRMFYSYVISMVGMGIVAFKAGEIGCVIIAGVTVFGCLLNYLMYGRGSKNTKSHVPEAHTEDSIA